MKVYIQIIFFLAVFDGQTQLQSYAQSLCNSQSDCLPTQKCCKPSWSNNVCAYSCVGKSCSYNSDCGSGESCCNNYCRDSCTGYSCIVNSDCGGYDKYCCNYTCRKGTCGLASWVVAVIVLCVLGGVATIAGIMLCAYCSNRRGSPGFVVTGATVSTVAMPMATVADSNHDDYPRGPPPAYHEYQPPQVYQPLQTRH